MDKRDHKTDLNNAKALRKEAERRYRQEVTDLSHLDQSDRAKLMQELQIHQIELEMQNEELRESQLQLEEFHQQYLDLYNDAPVGYASLDDSGMVLRCNRTLIELLGTEDQIMQGHALVEFMLEADQPIFRSRFRAFSHKPENKHIDVRFKYGGRRGGDTSFVGRIQGRRLDSYGRFGARGWKETLLVVISDVTELKHSEEKIAFQAYHDSLTGLPNRTQLHDRLETALALGARHASSCALLFMDLDRFKTINDSLGHRAGDELLIQFALRLHNHLRREDLLARMGGDEFVVLLSEQHFDSNQSALHAQRLAAHLIDTLKQPFTVMDSRIQVTVSIGITVFPFQPGDRVDDVLRQADTAMYQAKSEGHNQVRFFHSKLEQRARRRLALESELRTALQEQQFEIYYQPQIASHSGLIVGAEALLRWHHPQKGLLTPEEYIRIMEETGLILSAGKWILQQVATQMSHWRAAGLCRPEAKIAVNISPSQLKIDRFGDSVEKLLKAHELDPSCLVFEITENLLLPEDATCRSVMQQLKALGLTFSVDDFGTGYSSLFVLQNSDIGQLKIAQQFVKELVPPSNTHARSQNSVRGLIRTIITMAKELEMNIVAEGIETEYQHQVIRELGCDVMQGYLFAHPMPADEMTRLLEQQLKENSSP